MRWQDYTADTICAALGVGGFVDPSWERPEHPVLRLLLKPSFDPEVCLTFVRERGAVDLTVVTPEEMIWRSPAPGLVPTLQDRATISIEAFEAVIQLFNEAAIDPLPSDQQIVSVDGMSTESCLVTAAGLRRFRRHASVEPNRRLASLALTLAWDACRDARVLNRLAAAARYIGIERPEQPEPVLPAVLKVAVIGTPDDRADLMRALRFDAG